MAKRSKKEKDPERNKKRLIKKIKEVQKGSQNYSSKIKKIEEENQYVNDLAKETEKIVTLFPDDSYMPQTQWDNQFGIWEYSGNWIKDANKALTPLFGGSSSVMSITTSGVSSSIGPTSIIKPLPSFDKQRQYFQHIDRLKKIEEKAGWVEKVEEEINRLKLNAMSSGKQTPSSLLQEARQSFLNPATDEVSPAAVLLQTREAINTAIEELLKRRPKRERVKGKRKQILSILNQCGKSGVTKETQNIFASQAEVWRTDLSRSKRIKMDHETVQTLFFGACAFFKGFLELIDKNKLKQ